MNEKSKSFDRVREFLLNPASLPDHPGQVELAETHISCVFLTERFAYKLKKPVRFDFLDFSTPAARQRACLDEVRLNRRLTHDVYLGVAPIMEGDDGCLEVGACTECNDARSPEESRRVVDWLVVMRRLPAERTLEALLERGALTLADVDRVARRLADFYCGAQPISIEPDDYVAQVAAHVRGNRRELAIDVAHWPAGLSQRVHSAQLALVELEPHLLGDRASGGHVVEGHGDLRPEHIYCLGGGPEIIDCIEFQAEFRRLDGADELAFFAMECDERGAPWIGERVLAAYEQAMEDAPPERLWRFYKAYRACVRSKVAALRARQQPADEAQRSRQMATRYLQAADSALAGQATPVLVAVGGISGSGKSTLAAALAERLGAAHIATDRVRRDLFSDRAVAAAWGAGVYEPAQRERVYERAFALAEAALNASQSTILDATFLAAAMRRRASGVASQVSARRLLVECQCSVEEAKRRLIARRARGPSESDASLETIEQQALTLEPWREADVCRVDALLPLDEQVEQVLARLRRTAPRAAD